MVWETKISSEIQYIFDVVRLFCGNLTSNNTSSTFWRQLFGLCNVRPSAISNLIQDFDIALDMAYMHSVLANQIADIHTPSDKL